MNQPIQESFDLKPKLHNDMLLDPKTGDLYVESINRTMWSPKYNIGLHFKPMNERDELMKHINPRPVFKVSEVDRGFELFTTSHIESFCKIKRDKVNYYLFQGVDNTFVVKNSTNWMPHPFTFMSDSRKFRILAESSHMYQIIELGYIVGCMFDLNFKDKSHTMLVKNFTLKALNEVRNNDYKTPPLIQVISSQLGRSKSTAHEDAWKELYDHHEKEIQDAIRSGKDISTLKHITFDLDYFKHSGMTFRKDRAVRTVNENSINRKILETRTDFYMSDPFMKEEDRAALKTNSENYRAKLNFIYRTTPQKATSRHSSSRQTSKSRGLKSGRPTGKLASLSVGATDTENSIEKSESKNSVPSSPKRLLEAGLGFFRRYKSIEAEYALRDKRQTTSSFAQNKQQTLQDASKSSKSFIKATSDQADAGDQIQNQPVCIIRVSQNMYKNVQAKVKHGILRGQKQPKPSLYDHAVISYLQADDNDDKDRFYMKRRVLRRPDSQDKSLRPKSFRF